MYSTQPGMGRQPNQGQPYQPPPGVTPSIQRGGPMRSNVITGPGGGQFPSLPNGINGGGPLQQGPNEYLGGDFTQGRGPSPDGIAQSPGGIMSPDRAAMLEQLMNQLAPQQQQGMNPVDPRLAAIQQLMDMLNQGRGNLAQQNLANQRGPEMANPNMPPQMQGMPGGI